MWRLAYFGPFQWRLSYWARPIIPRLNSPRGHGHIFYTLRDYRGWKNPLEKHTSTINMNLKFRLYIITYKWWSRAKFWRKIPTCRDSVGLLNVDDVTKRNAKTTIYFEPFISKPWFLYGKCLVFCSLSNEPNFGMIELFWFFVYRGDPDTKIGHVTHLREF